MLLYTTYTVLIEDGNIFPEVAKCNGQCEKDVKNWYKIKKKAGVI